MFAGEFINKIILYTEKKKTPKQLVCKYFFAPFLFEPFFRNDVMPNQSNCCGQSRCVQLKLTIRSRGKRMWREYPWVLLLHEWFNQRAKLKDSAITFSSLLVFKLVEGYGKLWFSFYTQQLTVGLLISETWWKSVTNLLRGTVVGKLTEIIKTRFWKKEFLFYFVD